ncbi:MAG: hypothetical protein OEX81_03220 [Candidatus Pacebacteria bacterium]|nr:hypothetical protein [Candidatus Paceibacterota bacterium]
MNKKFSKFLVKLRFKNKPQKPFLKRFGFFLIFLTIIIAIFSYFTNPFVKFSLVKDPYAQVVIEDGNIVIKGSEDLTLRGGRYIGGLAKLKSGWHIVSSRFTGGKKASSNTVDEIIKEIHLIRFDPSEPYLISGDHFSMLYPRSLGIFYHSLLDDRTALSETDWKNRQVIYLKTLTYASNIYSQSSELSTTIVPVGPGSVALMNIYAVPSDTLYSLLFAYQQLIDNSYQRDNYPYDNDISYDLATKEAATKLLAEHKDSLKRHYDGFKGYAYDEQSGLIRKNILLSGTKDIMKKYGAFYDNVVFWKTAQLAQDLGVIEKDQAFLDQYKQRIIDTYWLGERGHFLEDLSEESLSESWYSSDWMIAFQTGFLDPDDEDDLVYLTKTVEYIQRNAIDKPFALQYSPDKRNQRMYGVVKWLSPEYGSTTIWSNWGMEYTKLLIRLAQVTNDITYLEQAKTHLDAYTFNIKRYQGYPEVYDQEGDFYKTPLYKSIRRTGWVVTFEQAREMYKDLVKDFNQ